MADINVANILEQYSKGFSKEYDALVNHLNNPSIEDKLLMVYIRGLRDCLTVLDQQYEELVGVILRFDWTSRHRDAVKEYQGFLIDLVSAQPSYLKSCLKSLVWLFYPKYDPKIAATDPVTKETRQKDEARFVNTHLVLKNISRIVPLMFSVLLPILRDMFPYLSKSAYIQECYVRNILQTTNYILTPNFRQQILELVVDRMLKIDARCSRCDIEDFESENLPEEDGDIFNLDKEEILDDMSIPCNPKLEMKHLDARKLDCMMELMLTYIERACYKEGSLNWEETKRLYREFLTIFDKVIFPTHASCHVQFILFYFCSLKPAICEGFLDYLWKKLICPNTETVYRQASVAYIASLISRGRFVSVSVLKMCLELMCSWTHQYLEQASHTTRADIQHHGPFYSVCQAIFYVFAFRHKDLFETHKGYKWAKGLNLQTLVTCRLNPLRFCLPVIVSTFSSVTRAHQLVFCDTIVERNGRAQLPETLPYTSPLSRLNTLDSFFPFDPYLLLRSQHFISPIYREYEGLPIEEKEMMSEDEDDFLPETNQETESSSLKNSPDFMNYGISPGFKSV